MTKFASLLCLAVSAAIALVSVDLMFALQDGLPMGALTVLSLPMPISPMLACAFFGAAVHFRDYSL